VQRQHLIAIMSKHAGGRLRTFGSQQKLSVHVLLAQAVDCLLAFGKKPAPQVCVEHCMSSRAGLLIRAQVLP
jgi:hypothetical protein